MTDFTTLRAQLDALIVPGEHWLPTLGNVSAALMQAWDGINWAGFYLRQGGDELLLGPFQGKTACVHIPFGRGVCGTAARNDQTQVVPDVHEFPGHIACDADSRSEIVVPLHDGSGRVCGVIDIDSPVPGRFGEAERELLEYCAALLAERTDLHGII